MQKVASLSLRFILKKLMNSMQALNVAPVASKISIPILQKSIIKFKRILSKIIKIPALESTETHLDLSALLPVSPLYYDRPHSAAAKAEAGKARTPLLKKIGEKYFEKAT